MNMDATKPFPEKRLQDFTEYGTLQCHHHIAKGCLSVKLCKVISIADFYNLVLYKTLIINRVYRFFFYPVTPKTTHFFHYHSTYMDVKAIAEADD